MGSVRCVFFSKRIKAGTPRRKTRKKVVSQIPQNTHCVCPRSRELKAAILPSLRSKKFLVKKGKPTMQFQKTISLFCLIISILSIGYTAVSGEIEIKNRFGFTLYDSRDGHTQDTYDAVKKVHAGWVQAEGPSSLSVHWGQIVKDINGNGLMDDNWDWSPLDWTKLAEGEPNHLNVLMTINTGHDAKYKINSDRYTAWVECDDEVDYDTDCPPKNEYWQAFYDFVYEVVLRFNGEHDGLPRILWYQSKAENNSQGYWSGTKDEYYGNKNDTTMTLQRKDSKANENQHTYNDNLEIKKFPRAYLPIMYQAIKDANKDAKLVMGASSEGQGYKSAHLFELASQIDTLYGPLCEYDDGNSEIGTCYENRCKAVSRPFVLKNLIHQAEKYAPYTALGFCDKLDYICRCPKLLERLGQEVSGKKRGFFNRSLITRINSKDDENNYNIVPYDIYGTHAYGYSNGLTSEFFNHHHFIKNKVESVSEEIGKEIPLIAAGVMHSLVMPKTIPADEFQAYNQFSNMISSLYLDIDQFYFTYLSKGGGIYNGKWESWFKYDKFSSLNKAGNMFNLLSRTFNDENNQAYLKPLLFWNGSYMPIANSTQSEEVGILMAFGDPSKKYNIQPNGAAAIWCVDTDPYTSLSFENDECEAGKAFVLSEYYIDFPPGTPWKLYDFEGRKISSCEKGDDCGDKKPQVTLVGAAPQFLVWGSELHWPAELDE